MTTATTIYIGLKKAEEKNYFNMDAESVFLDYNGKSEVETPIYSKEIIFVLDGSEYEDCGCGRCDLLDAEYKGWEHCPFCGYDIVNRVYEKYKTREDAEKSKYSDKFGIIEYLAVSAHSPKGHTPVTGGLFK